MPDPVVPVATATDVHSIPRIVLLCSANRKAPHPAPAIELYRSEFFRLGRSYARQLRPKCIFVLSAEYGLVPADRELGPYTMTMSALGKGDVNSWGQLVAKQVHEQVDVDEHEVVVLGLSRFANPIIKHLPHTQAPLVGMTLSQAMNFLRSEEAHSGGA